MTVANGYITSTDELSCRGDGRFFSAASGTVVNEIISAQSLNVAAVSVAAFSPNGKIEAVADAPGISCEKPAGSANGGDHSHGGHQHDQIG